MLEYKSGVKVIMDNCLFCKIIKGEIPSFKIYEDEYTYAFLDISKDVDGHTLVVSKTHCANILDCDEKELLHIMKAAKLISNHYINNCGYDGVNLLSNVNEAGEQSIMHIHFHIIPRKNNDDFKVFPSLNSGKEELQTMHQKLKIN